MIIKKSLDSFRVTVPCKVNLFLEVLGKREDGYHSIDTVMMAVSLADELEITRRMDDRLELLIEFPNGWRHPLGNEDLAWRIPADQSNLVVRALDRLRKALCISSGASVRLIKRIPAMAGLGGGSADAAAALVLGLLLWGTKDDYGAVREIASELGSDINFFLEGQRNGFWLARCTGRGETIEPLECLNPIHFVIVHPPKGCGTREVFAALQLESFLRQRKLPETLLKGLKEGDVKTVGGGMFNRLENAAMRTTNWIDRSRRQIDRYDHHGQCMTGSGSARFCLCTTSEQAEKIVSELRTIGGMRAYYAQSWKSAEIEEQLKEIRNEL